MKFKVLIFLLLVSAMFPAAALARAALPGDLSNFAWSSNIGWISFSGPNYWVNVDNATKNLSGNAWSSNVGWLSFDRSNAGNPPKNDIGGGSGPIAKIDAAGKLMGWARFLSGNTATGWDGWVKLSSVAGDPIPYGVSQVGSNLTGFAWGSEVVGWIKFCDPAKGYCVTSGPPVVGFPPTVTISASPTSVPLNTSSTLTWTTTNAASCSASGGWSGSKPFSGSESTGSLTTDTTFTLSCTSATGVSAQNSVTVTVIGSQPQCNNGSDDSDPEDTLADAADPGCHDINGVYDPSDNNETNPAGRQCSNGSDDTDPEDTLADWMDPGCYDTSGHYDPNDNNETDVVSGVPFTFSISHSPSTDAHPHFKRDIAISFTSSSRTVLKITPIPISATGNVKYSIDRVEKDVLPCDGNPILCGNGKGDGVSVDSTDGKEYKSKFVFTFSTDLSQLGQGFAYVNKSETITTQDPKPIGGLLVYPLIDLQVTRLNIGDGRYVIYLNAEEDKPGGFKITPPEPIVLVIGSQTPGFSNQ